MSTHKKYGSIGRAFIFGPVRIKETSCDYVPHRREGGHIVFGADPVGVGVSVSVTLSCLHDIS